MQTILRTNLRGCAVARATILLTAALPALSGCGPDDGEQNVGTASAALICHDCNDLYVVAHQDDDLLFMSTDVPESIQRGNTVWITYLTAGDAGDSTAYWQGRETGIERAYAQMANLPNSWTTSPLSLAGHSVHSRTLNGSSLRVVFMRLPDGNSSGTGYAVTSNQSLRKLWEGSISSASSVDGIQQYTRSGLIDSLYAIVTQLEPERISVLDPTDSAHGSDHSDHIHSARFMLTARQRYQDQHAFSMHRTYNISGLPLNLSSAQINNKDWYFSNYAVHDSHMNWGCGGVPANCNVTGNYASWLQREYPKSAVQGVSGRMTGKNGVCLDVTGGSSADGTQIQIWSCAAVPQQQWQVGADQTIRSLGKCLTAAAPYADQTPVKLSTCNNSPGQRFSLLSDGRVLGPEGQCLDIYAGGTANGTPIQLYRCHDVPQQRWTVEAALPTQRSSGTNFSDADIGSTANKARSLDFGDIDGDGDADACIRRSGGVYCALNQAGNFGAYTLWTTEYSDALGWNSDAYGPTLDYADINGDGIADVCGRGGSGILCAHSNGTSFGASSWRTSGGDFGNGQGYNAASRALSVHLADVNGDGRADVCGRHSSGIYCALNNGSGTFAPATSWLSNEFTDAQGWGNEVFGSTIMFGDLDGDGYADVCGRGTNAVICAKSTGSAFADPSPWGFGTDFSNQQSWGNHVAYYGSVRLADIDGDGGADLCGRGGAGLWCAISQGGNSFDEKRLILPQGFSDGAGYLNVLYGATLQWADINGDGRADPCARGPVGLNCSVSP